MLKVEPKGRRRQKRLRGDMDDLAGYTGMKQFVAVILLRLRKLKIVMDVMIRDTM
jgi:hypothetical protein